MRNKIATTSLINQCIVGVVILAPALDVLFSGRNLIGNEYFETFNYKAISSLVIHGNAFFSSLSEEPVSSLLSRATALVVLLSMATIALCLFERRTLNSHRAVMGGFLIYFATNTLFCVPFSVGAFIDRSHFYPLLLFSAFFLSADDGADGILDVAKSCLTVTMVASLIAGVAFPEMTLRDYEEEVRLPFVDFRFWGLSEGANAIGPLALTQILITMCRPFKTRVLTIVSLVSGAMVLVLAQSQTAWLAAIVTVPSLAIYHSPRFASLRAGWTTRLTGWLGVIVCAIMITPLLMAQAVHSGLLDNSVASGRPEVWNAAINTFESHPLFGYGLQAWNREFRNDIYIPWAVHAHNQLLQSLSVAGIFGGVGLLVYVWTLFKASVATAPATRGLAPAVLTLILVRTLSEPPLDIGAVMIGSMITHMLLFRLLLKPGVSVVRASTFRATTLAGAQL